MSRKSSRSSSGAATAASASAIAPSAKRSGMPCSAIAIRLAVADGGAAAEPLDHARLGQAEPPAGAGLRAYQLAGLRAHRVAPGDGVRGPDPPVGRVQPAASGDPPVDPHDAPVRFPRKAAHRARFVGVGPQPLDPRENAVAGRDGCTRTVVGQHLDTRRGTVVRRGGGPRRGDAVLVHVEHLQDGDRRQSPIPPLLRLVRVFPASQGRGRPLTPASPRRRPFSSCRAPPWGGTCRPWPRARRAVRPHLPWSACPRPRPWAARRWSARA